LVNEGHAGKFPIYVQVEFERLCLQLMKTETLKFLQNNLKTLNNIHKDSSNNTGLVKALVIIMITALFCLSASMINCEIFVINQPMHYLDKLYWSNALLLHVSMCIHHIQGALVAC
jgi:uncharacterized membrane protein